MSAFCKICAKYHNDEQLKGVFGNYEVGFRNWKKGTEKFKKNTRKVMPTKLPVQ